MTLLTYSLTLCASLTFDLVRSFSGQSQLPVHQLDRSTLITPRARVRPLGAASGKIKMSAWRLAHAIMKADCVRRFPALWLHVGAAGFLIEHLYLFDWNPENLRLAGGMANAYADVTRTSLAGRIAQGMTILFMEERGYAFSDRFTSFLRKHNGHLAIVQRPGTRSGSAAARRKRDKTPDFVFEKHSHGSAPPERALAESKGGFVSPGSNPDIKGDLGNALDQLDGWDRRLSLPVNKLFAVGTYLREADDDAAEPSLLAFVDPESGDAQGTIEFPADAIRRANYAAWLSGMGFNEAALRLLAWRPSSGTPLRLPVIFVGDRGYAVAIASVWPKFASDAVLDDKFWMMLEKWPFLPPSYFGRGFSIHVMGLELNVLRCLGEVTTTGRSDRLMALEPVIEPEPSPRGDAESFHGSVFKDGTVLGELQVPRGVRPMFRVEEVVL